MTRRPLRWISCAVLTGVAALGAAAEEEPTIGSLAGETVELRPGGLIVDSTDRARESYRDFLDLLGADPELRAEAMRRLGDLELEALEADQLSRGIESGEYESAVALFRQLLESFPEYRRSDGVLYQLARAYEIGGRTEEALAVLDEIAARYPDTAFIDEVHFRRGEMMFLRKDYAGAEDAYRYVTEFGEESRFYEQSLYKLGWSHFKLAMYEESLDPFFGLLDRKIGGLDFAGTDEQLGSLGRAERELVDDTFRVLSISFSYMDGPDSIDAYLAGRGRPAYTHVIYMNLGDLYLDKERYVDAAEAYEAFVRWEPDHPRAPLLQVEVIEAYKQGGFPSLVLDAKKEFVDLYGMDKPFWLVNAPAEHPVVAEHLKANLDDLAQYYHAQAQEHGKRTDYQEAARWYRKYLDYFPGQADSANTNFLLAEILYESEDYYGATLEYERTAYDYPPHERSADAAYAALLASRQHEITLDGTAVAAWHQRYLDSGLRFADTFPEHPESGAVLTTVAEDLFAQGQFDLAIAVGQTVIAKEPAVAADLAGTAWTVIAHSQFDLGNYAEAESAYYRMRTLVPPDEAAAHGEIDERIASAIYRQGENARDAGDLESAVAHFMRIGDAVPASPIRATAEYDAAAALITLGAWDRASSVLEDYRRNYPDSEFADDVAAKLAVTYLESGRGADAAREFERIASAPDALPEVRREALWKAAELYRGAGVAADEERLLATLVERYPYPVAESIEARQRLVDLAEARGDNRARFDHLEAIVRADATAGAERSDRTRYLAATASLALAEPLRHGFAAAALTQPLAESVKRKRAVMETVLEAYGRAADYGVAEVTTAATFHLADVYRTMAADLMDSERPAELDDAALVEYEFLLEEQAFPLEEKAIELYQVNTARASDGVYDDWVKKSFDELAKLMPARYAKLERGEDVVTALY